MTSRLSTALLGVGACLTLAGCLGDRPPPINQAAPSAAAPARDGLQDGLNSRPGQRGDGPYAGRGGAPGIGTGGGRGGNGGRGGDSD